MDSRFIKYCIDSEVLSQEALRKALALADDDTSIYATLIHQGTVSQEQLAIAAGEFYECPVVDLSRVEPEVSAAGYGNVTVCRSLQFVPFSIDPAVGVLVALADYTKKNDIESYLKTVHIERMKFYIAPYDTLMDMIRRLYGAPIRESLQKRRNSILRTQCLDLSSMTPNTANDAELKAAKQQISDLKEENLRLKQRLEQLAASIELETMMVRKLAQMLRSKGVINDGSFEQWLDAQR